MTFMELLLSAKLGSTSAFEELFVRYKNLLRKYSVVNVYSTRICIKSSAYCLHTASKFLM